MSDPTEVAAQRAWERKYGSTNSPWREGFPNQVSRGFVDAAREALQPIRELHKPQWDNCINACCSGKQCRLRSQICEHCYEPWPCPTAKLIYSTEELAQ